MGAGPRELIDELRRSVRDERVLAAIAAVPRERFVPHELRARAWENEALPIGRGQTISQPLVVAHMCEALALTGRETVLDVGTGSGYHAAVLSCLCARVITIERDGQLADDAVANLASAGSVGVKAIVGDGTDGHPPEAPYHAICVAAASAEGVPEALVDQLADGGHMVIPVGRKRQRLVRVTRTGTDVVCESLGRVAFVPLVRGGG